MRAKRILAQARHEGRMCAAWISGAVASGVWAVMAAMSGLAPGGALLAVAAVIALRLAGWHWSERRRLRLRVWPDEIRWNPPMVIRADSPAVPRVDTVITIGLSVAVGVPLLLLVLNLAFTKLL